MQVSNSTKGPVNWNRIWWW